jgi:Flp pilus assembly protein TadG
MAGRGPRGKRLFARGQSMTELALIMPVLLVLLVVGIQYAVIGDCALAVTQLSYDGARYASVNPTYTLGTGVKTYMLSVASPLIMSNNGGDLSITMPVTCPSTNPFSFPVTITVQYNLASKIFLPTPFFLGITFPTTVQSTQTAFCEGGAP